jgi:hypothetical protein
MFEYRVLRRIFGTKRDEQGDDKKLHTEELRMLYRPSNIIIT